MIYVIEAVLAVTEIYMGGLIQKAVPKRYNVSSVRVPIEVLSVYHRDGKQGQVARNSCLC